MFNTVEEWVACLRSDSLPVLPRTLESLTRLAADDDVSGEDLAHAILDDPLMTLKVLRYVNVTKHKHFNTDITSVGPALMMLGTGNFFSKFARMHTVDEHLRDFPEVREALYLLVAKARHSAFQARDWANYRKDSRVSEVRVAALLHDMGEMLVTCYAPELTDNLLKEAGPVWRRHEEAQRHSLGFTLKEFHRAVARAWELPPLLVHLMDDDQPRLPRPLTVALADRVGWRMAHGVRPQNLLEESEELAGLLHLSFADAQFRIYENAALFAAGVGEETWLLDVLAGVGDFPASPVNLGDFSQPEAPGEG